MGFSKEEFREWLRTYPRDTVGYANRLCGCPLSLFYTREGSPYMFAIVSASEIKVTTPEEVMANNMFVETIPIEPWQRTFIQIVDGTALNESAPVRREKALQILDWINDTESGRI